MDRRQQMDEMVTELHRQLLDAAVIYQQKYGRNAAEPLVRPLEGVSELERLIRFHAATSRIRDQKSQKKTKKVK